MTHDADEEKFGRLRRLFWPIHSREVASFVPMLIICFFVGFVYHVLRNMKDTLIVTASDSGAAAIPFVKMWAMLPMTFLWTAIFIRLSHKHSSEKVFYIIVSSFLAFFTVFAFFLYPIRELIHPHALADNLRLSLPNGFGGMISMLEYWTYSLFYGMAELWGVIVFAVLFWGYVNEVTKVPQAKRFYGLLGIGANLASIAAGQASCILASHAFNPNWILGADKWAQSLILLTLVVLFSGAVILVLFYYFSKATKPVVSDEDIRARQLKKMEKKGSIADSIRTLMNSKYLVSLAVVVLAYNVAINLTEVLWKDQVRQICPDPNAYSNYMGIVTSVTGIMSTVLAIGVASIFRRVGWSGTALITPLIMVVTSIGFFIFYFMPAHQMAHFTTLFGMTPVAVMALIGSTQNCFARGCKYTVFDATKEVAYIPLTKQERVSGKGAIDGVASRVGKSGGSLVYQGLLVVFGTLARSAPAVAGILVIFLSAWMMAVVNLGKQFHRLTTKETATTGNEAVAT